MGGGGGGGGVVTIMFLGRWGGVRNAYLSNKQVVHDGGGGGGGDMTVMFLGKEGGGRVRNAYLSNKQVVHGQGWLDLGHQHWSLSLNFLLDLHSFLGWGCRC